MAVVAFPARNKLVYPAGIRAGIDPSHPASTGLVLSCVAGPGNNYVNLLTGASLNAQTVETGDHSASIDSSIGPAVTAPASAGKALGISINHTYSRGTFAGIFRYSSISTATYQTIIAVNGGFGLFTSNDKVNFYNSADEFGATLALGTPYFVACSIIKDSTLNLLSIVVKNLVTGQIFTTVISTIHSPYAGTAVSVGVDTSAEASNFPIAAAAFSDIYLSAQQLLQWADDPWAFWYPPQTTQQLAAVAAAAAQYVAFSIPQRDGGALTQMIGY